MARRAEARRAGPDTGRRRDRAPGRVRGRRKATRSLTGRRRSRRGNGRPRGRGAGRRPSATSEDVADGYTAMRKWAKCVGLDWSISERPSADGRLAIRWTRTSPFAAFRSPEAALIAPVTAGWSIGRQMLERRLDPRRSAAARGLKPLPAFAKQAFFLSSLVSPQRPTQGLASRAVQ